LVRAGLCAGLRAEWDGREGSDDDNERAEADADIHVVSAVGK
jgi:hypothetical protein